MTALIPYELFFHINLFVQAERSRPFQLSSIHNAAAVANLAVLAQMLSTYRIHLVELFFKKFI